MEQVKKNDRYQQWKWYLNIQIAIS